MSGLYRFKKKKSLRRTWALTILHFPVSKILFYGIIRDKHL